MGCGKIIFQSCLSVNHSVSLSVHISRQVSGWPSTEGPSCSSWTDVSCGRLFLLGGGFKGFAIFALCKSRCIVSYKQIVFNRLQVTIEAIALFAVRNANVKREGPRHWVRRDYDSYSVQSYNNY